ncbi:hypothetical protein CEXT_29671 [Caerostris extrusa]|uniref:Uncharacterized protein n=1 Tax=Caerostris extrusa TaxID=172846 RepID=A0AAV4U684_CAEEX|nr:hypothetical protein CEXT_29671 [Caerostris extrusa]
MGKKNPHIYPPHLFPQCSQGIKGQKNVLKDVLSESIAHEIIPEGLSWHWIYDFDTNRRSIAVWERGSDLLRNRGGNRC